ncbi:hypothetical protein LCGC14_3057340, partial [marine sediment metagenome]
NHNLELIQRFPVGVDGEERAIRWCSDCGGVVVDLDVDGRAVGPGDVMKMRFPGVFYQYIELKKLHSEAAAGAKYPKDWNKYGSNG